MFNTMNTVRPRPYPQRGTSNYNAGNDGTDKDGHNSQEQDQRQNQQNRQNMVRQNANAAPQQPIPQRMAAYSPANNAYPTYNNPNIQPHLSTPMEHRQINPQQYQAIQGNYQPVQQPQLQAPQNSMPSPTVQRSNKVNIAQILKDFRNTIKAIATPEEIEAEVNKFLQMVEQQVREPQPQVNLIQSNLKQAACLLDRYISETLNKESKVVQNWLDALFLQRINYSYNENEINPSFLVKFPEDDKKPVQPEEQNKPLETTTENRQTPAQNITQNIPQPNVQNNFRTEEIHHNNLQQNIVPQEQFTEIDTYVPQTLEEEFVLAQQKISNKPNITIIPQDTRLKTLFVEAKKMAFYNNPQKAMSIFKEAFNRAGELKDTETQSRICLEIGKIYDDNDFVAQALTSYNKSLQYTTDTNVKSKAHYSMAQIYDDVNEVGAALEHYITSISYAGKTDDLSGQSDSLTKVANIFTDKYDENNAFDYYDVARKLVEQTKDDNMKGYVFSNTADACVQFRKNDKALKYYAEAVRHYEHTNSKEEIAKNYKSAAELMIDFNSPAKAKSLLKKAMVNAVKTENEDLISEINLLLAGIN